MKNIAKLVFAVAVLAAPCVVNSQQTDDPKVALPCPVDRNGYCTRVADCFCIVGKPPQASITTKSPWLLVNR